LIVYFICLFVRSLVLSFDDDITQLDLAADNSLLAVSAAGRVALWKDVTQTILPLGKKKRTTTRSPVTVLAFSSTAAEGESIPIIAACYAQAGEEASKVLVARGSSVKPVFETVVS
jgi:hypothetical protein